jgi:hypothetical protein
MLKFEAIQTSKLNLTSYSRLALIGQCCEAAQVNRVIDPRLPVSPGIKTSDLVKVICRKMISTRRWGRLYTDPKIHPSFAGVGHIIQERLLTESRR